MLKQNKKLAKEMNFQKFVASTVRRKGCSGMATEDPAVTRTNNQILLLEEIFESRRNLDVKRPSIKEQVF